MICKKMQKLDQESSGLKLHFKVDYPEGLEDAANAVMKKERELFASIIEDPNQFGLDLETEE